MKDKISLPWVIFLTALVLRLIPVLATRSLGIGLDDMFQYDMLGRSLAQGNGYRWYMWEDVRRLEPWVDFDLSSIDYDPDRGVRTTFRAPLYPGFLALIYTFTGTGFERFFGVRIVQAGLTAVLAPLTYTVSRRIFPRSGSASAIAAWIVACYPMYIVFPVALATENLFFPLLLTSFLYLLKTADQPGPGHALLSGLFLALTLLTRSVITLFAAAAVVWLWFTLQKKSLVVLTAFTALALITPWIIRNSLLHRKPTGLETSLGYNLYVGYHPESDGSFTFGPSLDLVAVLDDDARNQFGTQKALEYIHADPPRFWTLARNRLGIFFGLEKRALIYLYSNNFLGHFSKPVLLAIGAILFSPFVIVSTSAALGLALARPRPGIILLYLLFLTYTLPHILILSEDRFHLAILPFFSILAAQAWTSGRVAFIARWNESLAGKIAVSLSVTACLLLLVNWGFELSRDADKIIALLGPNGNQLYFPY